MTIRLSGASWVMLALSILVVLVMLLINAPRLAVDYGPLYYSGHLLADGESLYDHSRIAELIVADGGDPTTNRFLYTPVVTVLAYPLSMLPVLTAATLIQIFNVLASVFAVWLLILLLPAHYRFKGALFSSLLILVSLPFWVSSLMGQINGILLLGLALFIWSVIRDKKGIAGIALGIIILLKIFPLVFIGLCLAKRQWGVICFTFLTVAVLVLGSLLVVSDGLGQYQTYISDVLPDVLSNENILSDRGVSSLTAIGTTVFSDSWSASISILIPLLGYGIWFLFVWWRPHAQNNFLYLVDFAITVVLIFLLSRYVIFHYYIWALIPLFVMLWYWFISKQQWIWWVIGSVVMLLSIHLLVTKALMNVTHDLTALLLYPALWASIILMGGLLHARKRHFLDSSAKVG